MVHRYLSDLDRDARVDGIKRIQMGWRGHSPGPDRDARGDGAERQQSVSGLAEAYVYVATVRTGYSRVYSIIQ